MTSTDSSWIKNSGKHGTQCTGTNANSKSKVKRTVIEELQLHEAKDEHVQKHDHWFSRLWKFMFNPYTKDETLPKQKTCKIFPCLFSQPGHGKNILQAAIGLQDDHDDFNEIHVSNIPSITLVGA
jgi:hypothetical protein